MSKYPQDLIVTVDDFKNSGYAELIGQITEPHHTNYHSALSKEANIAIKAGEIEKGKVLWLLADVMSMMLRPENLSDPFQPMWIIDGRRSALPEDFSVEDLILFDSILPEISDIILKARLTDVLWLVKQPRNVQYALDAIDAYRSFPLEAKTFLGDIEDAWERGIRLAKTLGEGGLDKLIEIRESLYNAFQAAEFDERFYLARLSDLLAVSSIDNDKFKSITAKLEEFAQKAKAAKDGYCAVGYVDRAIDWNTKTKNHQECYRLTVEKAEIWVAEAESRKEAMVSGHFYESAIKAYREIPNKERQQFKADERLQELHRLMNAANKLSLGEMKSMTTDPIDITCFVEESRKFVSGKKFPEAIVAVANIHSGIKVDGMEEEAKKSTQDSLIQLLCTSVHMTQDGRVAARSGGINLNDPESEETKQAIWQIMMRNYGLHVSLVVQAHIIPAFHIINKEHRIPERLLNSLCRNSRIIPSGRGALWAKGLFYGFQNDFTAAIHLLAPQLEHLVRTIMKEQGLKTTTLDSKGIETENGLSALLDNPDIEKAVDKNLLFEFKALLADSIGPNVRNEVAHGLLEFEDTRSTYAIYLWWLCLRLVVNTFPWKKEE